MRRRGRNVRRWQVAAGLIYGQLKKSYQRRKLVRVTHVMRLLTLANLTIARPRTGFLWTVEHRFHRAGESDRPTWRGSARTPHLGHGSAVPSPAGPSGVVAGLLSFCASSPSAASSSHAAARTRGQTSGAALPAAYPCHGSVKNHSTMDNSGGALLSFAARASRHLVSAKKVRRAT